MTCKESIKWLEWLKTVIEQNQYQGLLRYEQALAETIELLQSDRLIELPCKVGDNFFIIAQRLEKGEYTDFFIDKRQVSLFTYDGETLMIYDFDEIGFSLDDVYFEKSEAEAKLKELLQE